MLIKNFWRFLGVAALAGAAAMVPVKPASAHGHIGVFFGFSPFVYGPPVYYYPPPVYYYYPPAYEVAPQAASAGYTCYAGQYVCPLAVAHPVGGACDCPAEGGGAVGGTVR